MAVEMKPLHCEMTEGCAQPITHVDEKGYIYCATHGLSRRAYGIRCRKLLAHELRKLQRGEALKGY